MTETMPINQDEVKKDSSQLPSSTKLKSKPKHGCQSNDGNECPKTNEKVEKPPTKVVVRRLPPTMTLETFLDQVAPLPPVDYLYFVKADFSLAPNSFARAYLHFVHVGDLLIFTEKFDNYVFVDSKGNEYPAIVEYAPFQRIPKQRSSRKKDPRIGTIENDSYYQEFIEALKAEETQRKSASKTNKQHFFETSTGSVVTKVTSTPLLEFLKIRRADKLKTKEDKVAERRKREMERRKAREDARISTKHQRASEGDGDTGPQIKIAGHGAVIDKGSKETIEGKRSTKENVTKETSSKRREDERNKAREKERKDRERDARETQREPKKDNRRDSGRDQGSAHNKDKENQSSTSDTKSKEIRRGGKSYQEERQRLNERRLAAKGLSQKTTPSGDPSDKHEKEIDETNEVSTGDKKDITKKDSEPPTECKNRSQEGYKNSDQHRQPNSRDGRKYEKVSKSAKEPEQRRNCDTRKNLDEGKDMKKNFSNQKTSAHDAKTDDSSKLQPCKEETRKKSYNQERELRRAAAADLKNQTRRHSAQSVKSDERPSSKGNGAKDESHESVCKTDDQQTADQCGSNDLTRNESQSDVKPQSSKEVDRRKRESISRGDEKDKKDPRTERRIRNKDRPSIEIYRPGMGRFSRQRLEREKVVSKESSTERESPSSSPSPVPFSVKTSTAISEETPEKTAE